MPSAIYQLVYELQWKGRGKKAARMSERTGGEADGEQSEPSVMSALIKLFFNAIALALDLYLKTFDWEHKLLLLN